MPEVVGDELFNLDMDQMVGTPIDEQRYEQLQRIQEMIDDDCSTYRFFGAVRQLHERNRVQAVPTEFASSARGSGDSCVVVIAQPPSFSVVDHVNEYNEEHPDQRIALIHVIPQDHEPTIEERLEAFPDDLPGIAQVRRYPVEGATRLLVYVPQHDVKTIPHDLLNYEVLYTVAESESNIVEGVSHLVTEHPCSIPYNSRSQPFIHYAELPGIMDWIRDEEDIIDKKLWNANPIGPALRRQGRRFNAVIRDLLNKDRLQGGLMSVFRLERLRRQPVYAREISGELCFDELFDQSTAVVIGAYPTMMDDVRSYNEDHPDDKIAVVQLVPEGYE